MTLQTLNIWAGRVYEALIDHVQTQADTVDIFCFQEVYSSPELLYTRGETWDGGPGLSQAHRSRANIYQELERVLPSFRGIYHAAQSNADHLGYTEDQLGYGLATFTKHSVSLQEVGEVFVHRSKDSLEDNDFSTLPRNIQYFRVPYHGGTLTIINFHGLWNGQGKGDSPARLTQSHKLRQFMESCPGPVIVCGDFNLLPDTQSFQIVAEGMRNLVEESGVHSTRSSFYQKPLKFADYILVSPEVEVRSFQVLELEVSDHLPLLLEFA